MMLKQLKIKFIAITMILVSIILSFVFTLMYQSNVKSTYDKSVADLKTISTLDISKFSEPQTNKVLKELQFVPLFIVNIDESGVILSQIKSNISMDDESFKSIVKAAHESQEDIGTIKSMDIRYYKKHYSLYEKISFIDISRDNKNLENLFVVFIMTGAITLLFFFFIVLFLSNWALMPVEKTWNQQKQFIADASHELKTPLTVLLANMDILENNKSDTIQSQIKWIQASKQEAKQMKNLIEEMLFLAKSDANRIDNSKTTINVSDTLFSLILSIEVIAFEKNVIINYASTIDENLYTTANEKQLVSLFSILLENACKYSYEETSITAKLKREQSKIKFELNNFGPVIPKHEVAHIFERFYRVDKSRNKEHGGYGLGLSIAKKITDENNMKISVESSEEKGTTFKVIMNAADVKKPQ
ncbi:ATPase/histidine kinase/DNA gyrase B/HSP90 domain protein [[Eubacterium] yurii subsp. margaretiae ATCC 43715]|nr:ATPase/histidine kinase/DNA gyrase B/HSP90 domain protein [[Eubacterium] yurii subsp. margaretiae ATCC 43715]